MKLIEMSFWAALLIIAVIIIRALWLHKLPKKTFILLWGIILLRLLLPFELPAAWLPFELPRLEISDELIKQTNEAENIFGIAPADWQLQPISDKSSVFPWQITVYLAGLLLCAGFFCLAHRRFLQKCSDSLPLEAAAELPFKAKKNIRLRYSDKISQPFTYGIIKPTIILPKTLLHEEKARQKLVLLHEYMHIRHKDILLKYLLAAALCLHWFNPLVWVMYILANRDIELVCDEAVLRQSASDSRAVYAMTLISLEEQKAGFAPLCSGFNKNAIEERIKAIMKKQKLSHMGKLLSVLIVMALILATAGSAIAQTPNNEPQAPIEQQENIRPEQSAEAAEKLQLMCPLENAELTGTFCVRIHPITKETLVFDHITLCSASDDILAAADGIVKEIGYEGKKGNTLLLEHTEGITTAYTHCAGFTVAVGDTVKQGDIIGKVGATGMATGDCLGFYVFADGIACDPLNFFEISK